MSRAAARHGVGVYGTGPYRTRPATGPAELLLGYATLTPAAIRAGVRGVGQALPDRGAA
jgi:DNA-binding transcriptional MocR family regulator